jgi:hypothetical protein
VPQIWLTYDELAELMDCDAAAARTIAVAMPLARRKSRDGHTRAKLNGPLTDIFLDRITRDRLDRDSAVSDTTAYAGKLRTLFEQMARPRPALPPRADENFSFGSEAFPNR